MRKPTSSLVFDTYWKFANERQNIFFNKLNCRRVLTNDEIFLRHKFTNAYRASDRVSQYLIKDVIYNEEFSSESRDVVFRILLFKIFNKIETWISLKSRLKSFRIQDFNFNRYDKILTTLISSKKAIYSGAYIMTSGKNSFGYSKKHRNHLMLLDYMITDGFFDKVESVKSMEKLFKTLLGYPTIGNFLAYQFAVDINYSEVTNFSEMDFVMPGPGAKDGIRKCFKDNGDYSEEDIIRMMSDEQEIHFSRLGLNFKDLWGRKLQLIDTQNLFCEVDKYSRVAHPEISGISDRKRIKQVYKPKMETISFYYPPKWDINKKI